MYTAGYEHTDICVGVVERGGGIGEGGCEHVLACMCVCVCVCVCVHLYIHAYYI